jgi:hypothetical protein
MESREDFIKCQATFFNEGNERKITCMLLYLDTFRRTFEVSFTMEIDDDGEMSDELSIPVMFSLS